VFHRSLGRCVDHGNVFFTTITGVIMKSIIALIVLLTSTLAAAQHVDLRVGSNMKSASISSRPVFEVGNVTMNWEGGVQRWKEQDTVGYQLYATPTFRWALTKTVFVDAGVGVSVFNKTQFGTKTISTHFQFADHIGVAYAAKSYAIGVRYVHASNAGIKRPNPGLDSIQGTLSVGF
jgi:hypothetical protein